MKSFTQIFRLILMSCACLIATTGWSKTEVHVETAGTLSSLISTSENELKVTGFINGTDIKFIRQLINSGKVSILDWSGVSIVAGGDANYWNDKLMIGAASHMGNPTGILCQTYTDQLYVFVDSDVPSDATLYIVGSGFDKIIDNAKTGQKLKKGLNVIEGEPDKLYYILYTADTKSVSKRLEEWPEMKIHIEGGKVEGYYDASRHTDADYKAMLAGTVHSNFVLKGRHTIMNAWTSILKDKCPDKIARAVECTDSVSVWEKYLCGITEAVANGEKAGAPYYLTGGDAFYPGYFNNPTFFDCNGGNTVAHASTYGVHFSKGPAENVLCCIPGEYNENAISHEKVLLEIFDMFPSQYIHIGGDEARKNNWKLCPDCQARMKAEGLKSVEELQSYMIRRMERFAHEHGKRIIGWDEILQGGLAPDATVMSWHGIEAGLQAVREGHDVIFTPNHYYYLDHQQDTAQFRPVGRLANLEKVYSFEPLAFLPSSGEGTGEGASHHVLGVQGCLWTEHVQDAWHAEMMLYPRVFAIAETGWSQAEKKDWPDFERRATVLSAVARGWGYTVYRNLIKHDNQ